MASVKGNVMVFFNIHKVIAAIKSDEELSSALAADIELIFDLCPSILTLKEKCDLVHSHGKKLFIHLDLAEGIGKDRVGMEFASSLGVDGIISTRAAVIKTAHELGLLTVQRFFMVDSKSVETAASSLKNSGADMIEVMPGTVYKVIERLKKSTNTPIIAGGLIESEEELSLALAWGAAAISTGKKELWNK